MQLLKELTRGLELIDPFLKGFGFEYEDFIIDKGPDGHFTYASYRKESKKFLIEYHFSFGQVLYQFEDAIASHPFYLDNLGFKDKKLHQNYISENQLEAFTHILHDFEYLIDDFFKGECVKLKEISKLQDYLISEADRTMRKEKSIRIDTMRIEQARLNFRKKEFNTCITNYRFVENRDLLGDLDTKIIEYSKRHI